MDKFLNSLGAYILLLIVGVGFLSICNWTFNPSDWNGFSRFLIAVWVITTMRVFFDN